MVCYTRKYLCEKKWKLATWTVSPGFQFWQGKGKETDLYKNEQDCKKDDYYFFDYIRKYTLYNGEKTCMPTENEKVYEGTWMFVKGQHNVLTLQTNNGNIRFQRKIILLDESKLVWTNTKVEDGVTYTFTETFAPADAPPANPQPIKSKTKSKVLLIKNQVPFKRN